MTNDRLARLPGGDLISEGIEDLAHGRETVAALLVSIGAPRLRRGGLAIAATLADPEHQLYALLNRQAQDAAHSRYNALLGRLVSFERALGCAT